MLKFLNVSKQNVTVINGILIHANTHFITDTSQGWIFSNTKAEEGVCEVFIHYISASNSKKMMLEQPLWREYFNSELEDDNAKEVIMEHINQPILHVILNVHETYKTIMGEIINFVNGVLKKNNPEIGEVIIDTFVYSEIFQLDSSN